MLTVISTLKGGGRDGGRGLSVVRYPNAILKIRRDKSMKKLVLLAVMVLVVGFAGMATADVTFNFDPPALPDNSNAATIATYMTGLFGSPVSVAGHDGPVSETGIGSLLGGTNDGYIESESDSLFGGEHQIRLNFGSPITSVSFDYGQYLDEFRADYSTNGGSTWVNFYSNGYAFLHTDHVVFDLPDNTNALRFHDDAIGEVGIDNLVVGRVPEPATMLLLGAGLIGLVGYGRRRYTK